MTEQQAAQAKSKQGVVNMVELCARHGIRHAVLCPGSRSAPITLAFVRHGAFMCHSLIDERSAAFFALGIAQQLRQPVALVSTSGTATLNFAPAIAEAYYQHISLLVITADRPPEWIDQADGQTIRQRNLYANFIKKSFELPVETATDDDLWYAHRIVSEAINACRYPDAAPVHLNVPLREPLYTLPGKSAESSVRAIYSPRIVSIPDGEILTKLLETWQASSRRMIVAGQHPFDETLNAALVQLSASTVVLAEATSNIAARPNILTHLDGVMNRVTLESATDFQPDLLITFGGNVLSKRLKQFLRDHPPAEQWHLDISGATVDLFKSLTSVLPVEPQRFLNTLSQHPATNSDAPYLQRWQACEDEVQHALKKILDAAPFSEFVAVREILNALPAHSNLQLGNSMPVRYANLVGIDAAKFITVNCNRGTSGIDGTVSTAVGAATAFGTPTTLITGDLAFFYDSNALWNNHLPPNLKIIVLNNGGGGIFRLIDGASTVAERERFFATASTRSVPKLAAAFDVPCLTCNDHAGLQSALAEFYRMPTTAVLEVRTTSEIDVKVFNDFRKSVQSVQSVQSTQPNTAL